MKTSSFIVLLLLVLTASNAAALEPVMEPHAMVYYQVSFDGEKSKASRPVFGFRVDRVSFSPGGMIEYRQLLKEPAMFDFRVGNKGVEGIYISGVDYLRQYRSIYRADEESGGETEGDTKETAKAGTEGDTNETAEAGAEEKKTGELKQPPKIVRDIGNTINAGMEAAPAGVLMGLALGVALLAGTGH